MYYALEFICIYMYIHIYQCNVYTCAFGTPPPCVVQDNVWILVVMSGEPHVPLCNLFRSLLCLMLLSLLSLEDRDDGLRREAEVDSTLQMETYIYILTTCMYMCVHVLCSSTNYMHRYMYIYMCVQITIFTCKYR